MRNVARAWCYETGVAVGQEVGPDMPFNDYYEYFGPDYRLDVQASNMDNANTMEYLSKIKQQVFENLSRSKGAPSVQMQPVPRDLDLSDDEDLDDPEKRVPRTSTILPHDFRILMPDGYVHMSLILSLRLFFVCVNFIRETLGQACGARERV